MSYFIQGPAKTKLRHSKDDVGEIKPKDVKRSVQTEPSLAEEKAFIVEHLKAIQHFFDEAIAAVLTERATEMSQTCDMTRVSRALLLDKKEIKICAARAIAAVEFRSGAAVRAIAKKLRKGGVGLHYNQIHTLISAMIEMALNPGKPGVIIGPMQSGKTGLALAFAAFLAPMLFRAAGIKSYPMFLSTNQTTHKYQTQRELAVFLELYGAVEIKVGKGSISPSEYYTAVDFFNMAFNDTGLAHADENELASFDEEPTPREYRERIMRGSLDNPNHDVQIVYNRTGGTNVTYIRKKMAEAAKAGFSLMLLIDEPQLGASGPIYPTGRQQDNLDVYRGNVMRQILVDVNDLIHDADGAHIAIGFSATPFDIAHMENFWVTKARLAKSYVGFNMWNGTVIDPTLPMIETSIYGAAQHYRSQTPKIYDLTGLGDEIANKNVAEIRDILGARRVLKKNGRAINYAAARKAFDQIHNYLLQQRPKIASVVGEKLPELKNDLVVRLKETPGLCVRLMPNNDKSDLMIEHLGLKNDFQVFPYYGQNYIHENGESMTVAEILDCFYNPNDLRPPLFIVTQRARMADNFPRKIEIFIDLAESSGDLNALLQGLAGRACGHGKYLSQVVLSERPARILRDYRDSLGRIVYTPGRHGITVNGKAQRGRGQKIMRVGLIGPQAEDVVIKSFIEDVNNTIVKARFPDFVGSKMKGVGDTVFPMPELLRKCRTDASGREWNGLFEYLRDPEVQGRLFPHMEYMELVDPLKNEKITHVMRSGEKRDIGYQFDRDKTNMTLSFRWRPLSELNGGHYGISDRETRRSQTTALGSRTDRTMKFGGDLANLEAQVNLIKIPAERMYLASRPFLTELEMDKNGEGKGVAVAYMVTFPLKKEARRRPIVSDETSILPTKNHWAEAGLAEEEIDTRDGKLRERRQRSEERKRRR